MNYSGCNGVVKSGGETLAELTGFSIDQNTNALDNTIIDGTCNRRVKAGQKSWSGTIDAFYDPADPALLLLVNGAELNVELYPIGDAIGDQVMSGDILVTTVGIPIEKDGMITQSISFEGNGALTIAAVAA